MFRDFIGYDKMLWRCSFLFSNWWKCRVWSEPSVELYACCDARVVSMVPYWRWRSRRWYGWSGCLPMVSWRPADGRSCAQTQTVPPPPLNRLYLIHYTCIPRDSHCLSFVFGDCIPLHFGFSETAALAYCPPRIVHFACKFAVIWNSARNSRRLT